MPILVTNSHVYNPPLVVMCDYAVSDLLKEGELYRVVRSYYRTPPGGVYPDTNELVQYYDVEIEGTDKTVTYRAFQFTIYQAEQVTIEFTL